MINKSACIQDNIRRIIEEKGVTHKRVAEQLGMNRQQFSDMLCGRRVIRAEIVPQIAHILECSYDEIYNTDKPAS